VSKQKPQRQYADLPALNGRFQRTVRYDPAKLNAWGRRRNALALQMREQDKLTYRAIADYFGVQKERARQMVAKAERVRRWQEPEARDG
jgi:DNA-directed RNA polymerase sigma subunit (sigma70/sigma32)